MQSPYSKSVARATRRRTGPAIQNTKTPASVSSNEDELLVQSSEKHKWESLQSVCEDLQKIFKKTKMQED